MRKELLILEKTSDPKEYWKILIIYFLKKNTLILLSLLYEWISCNVLMNTVYYIVRWRRLEQDNIIRSPEATVITN
jgi:hypothetical protein